LFSRRHHERSPWSLLPDTGVRPHLFEQRGTVLFADESQEFWGYNVTRSSRIYLQKKNTKSTQKNNETLNYFFDSQTEYRLIPVTLEI